MVSNQTLVMALSGASLALSLRNGDYINAASVPLLGSLMISWDDLQFKEMGVAMLFSSIVVLPAAGVGYGVYVLGGKTALATATAILAGSAASYHSVTKVIGFTLNYFSRFP